MHLWKDADQLLINIFGRNFFKSALDFHGGDDGRGDSPPKLIAVPQSGELGRRKPPRLIRLANNSGGFSA